MTMLSLNRIRLDGGTQNRATIRPEVVAEYAAANGEMPPVIAYFDGTDYWLSDGFHRVAARQTQGKGDIEVDIRQGTQRDAILFSLSCNAKHGLQRTVEDKRRAVICLLDDDEWGQCSDRWIAETCVVGAHFVAKIREENESTARARSSQADSTSTDSSANGVHEKPKKRTRKGRDGKTRTVKAKSPKVVYLCARCSRIGVATCKTCKGKKNPIIDPRHVTAPQPAAPGPDEDREPGVDKPEDCEPCKDAIGHVVPGAIADAFLAPFDEAISLCQKLQTLIDTLATGPGGAQLGRFVSPRKSGERVTQRSKHLDALKQDLKGTRPHAVCPFCKGKQAKGCKGCNGAGWVTKTTWDGADDATKARLAS